MENNRPKQEKVRKSHFNIFSTTPIRFISIISLIVFCFIIINTFGIERLKANIEHMGLWAPIGIFFLKFISIVIPALPSTAYSLLSGAMLGFEKGLIVICIADFLSCSISFFLSRNYGRNVVKRLVGKKFMGKVESLSQKYLEDNFFLMTGSLMTGLFDFVCYGIGLTKVSWAKFAPALTLSILISNPPVVALGAGLLDGGKRILLIGIIGVLIMGYVTNKAKKKLV